MQTSEKLQNFTGAKVVPASVESPVRRDAYSGGRGIARWHVASVTILVGVREMCGRRIGTIGQ